MSDRQFDVYLDDVKSPSTAITDQLAEMIHAQALKPWEFHRAIYDRCDNEPLNEIIAGLWSRMRQARGLAQSEMAWGQEWGEQDAGG